MTGAAQRRANQRFAALMNRDDLHLRVGTRNTWLNVIGTAHELHGPTGVCTCCPRTN